MRSYLRDTGERESLIGDDGLGAVIGAVQS